MTIAASSATAIPQGPPPPPTGGAAPPVPAGISPTDPSSGSTHSSTGVGTTIISWVKRHEQAVDIAGLGLAGGVAGFLTFGIPGALVGGAAGAFGGAYLSHLGDLATSTSSETAGS